MPTYSVDPLHPDRLRCDRWGHTVAAVGDQQAPAVENLTAQQAQEYFPEAAGAVDMHEALCGWGEEGGAIWTRRASGKARAYRGSPGGW
jgi:hypothetical protein